MANLNMAQAINNALDIEMERDPNVFCLGIDIGAAGGVLGVTQGLQAKFGEKRVNILKVLKSVSTWIF